MPKNEKDYMLFDQDRSDNLNDEMLKSVYLQTKTQNTDEKKHMDAISKKIGEEYTLLPLWIISYYGDRRYTTEPGEEVCIPGCTAYQCGCVAVKNKDNAESIVSSLKP